MEENIEKEGLTERQLNLHKLLLTNPNKWFTQKEICDVILDYEYRERKNTSDKCSTIWQDREEINKSDEVENIIAMKNYCFKIANLEETVEEETRLYKNAMRNLKRMTVIKKKRLMDGQGRLLTIDLKPENTEEDVKYIEVFLRDLITE